MSCPCVIAMLDAFILSFGNCTNARSQQMPYCRDFISLTLGVINDKFSL